MCVCVCVCVCVAPWATAHQAPLSMKLSGQEYWSGVSFLTPGDLHSPGIKHYAAFLSLLHWQADSSQFTPPGKLNEALVLTVFTDFLTKLKL